MLTCTGSLSRNRTVGGFELGRGRRKLPEILASLDGKVAEGVRTTRAALGLARKLGVEMPITEQMGLILDEGKDPKEAIRDLMLRPSRDERLAIRLIDLKIDKDLCFTKLFGGKKARFF